MLFFLYGALRRSKKEACVRCTPGKSETIYDIAHALRAFKKEMKEAGILQDYKERRYHIPKSQKKREKMQRAKYFQWVSDLHQD